jgi:hypothetical protein
MFAYPPRGLILALVTPFDEKGGIDWPSLRQLIAQALPLCDGLFIGEGLVGEGLSLPNPMRLELLRGCWETVSGKKSLLLCPTASTAEETLSNVEVLENYILEKERNPFFGRIFPFGIIAIASYRTFIKNGQNARLSPFCFIIIPSSSPK